MARRFRCNCLKPAGRSRWKLAAVCGAIPLVVLLVFPACPVFAGSQEEIAVRLPTLKVGRETYTNVIVTSVTATDIYFTYSRGMGNAKLKDLDSKLKARFHYDPRRAREQEKEQAQASALYASQLRNAPKPAPRQPEFNPTVTVAAAASKVAYQYYRPTRAGRPRDFDKKVLAQTQPVFNCHSDFVILSTTKGPDGLFRVRFASVKISIGLPVTIILPLNPTAKTRAHEEGHRKISEHYYALGERAAQHAGETVVARGYVSYAQDLDAAEQEVIEWARRAVRAEYWRYTWVPSGKANRYYDQITDHGANDMDSDRAVEQAIKKFPVQVPE